jgi:predicted dehydrogenase
VLLDYGDGRSAVVDGGMMMPDSYPFTSELHLLGSAGAAEYRFRAGAAEVDSGVGRNDLWLYPGRGNATELSVSAADPYEAEVGYFVDCIRTGRAAERATPAAGLDALRVALAASRSLNQDGGKVEFSSDVSL